MVFHNFVEEVKSHAEKNRTEPKALLLLDQAPSHPPENELVCGDIEVMYMPPNVTAVIQPMDQNVIRLTKLYYKTMLMESIIAANDIDNASENEGIALSTALKKVNLKTALIFLSEAWQKLQAPVIAKCWKPILTNVIPENKNENEIEMATVQDVDSSATNLSNLLIDDNLYAENQTQFSEEVDRLDNLVRLCFGSTTQEEFREWIEENESDVEDEDAILDDSEYEDENISNTADNTGGKTDKKIKHESITRCNKP